MASFVNCPLRAIRRREGVRGPRPAKQKVQEGPSPKRIEMQVATVASEVGQVARDEAGVHCPMKASVFRQRQYCPGSTRHELPVPCSRAG